MTSLECVPIPGEEEMLSAMCITYAMDVAIAVVNATQIKETELSVGYVKCPNGEGFHSILTVNGKRGFSHLHWKTEQQAVDFARRSWEVVDKVLNSWHIHSPSGQMNLN